MKYVTCAQIQTELHLLCEAVRKAGANIIIPRREVKSKTDLMDLYGYLYRECEKYNAEVLAERQAKVEQESAERALKSSNRHERKAARLSDAEERFTRYSDELAKREAGDMMGLDAKGQKHRIASLKRKIARAEVSMKKLQENS